MKNLFLEKPQFASSTHSISGRFDKKISSRKEKRKKRKESSKKFIIQGWAREKYVKNVCNLAKGKKGSQEKKGEYVVEVEKLTLKRILSYQIPFQWSKLI